MNKKYRAALKGIDLKVSHVKSAALELEKGLSAETVRAGDISRLLGGVAEHLSVMKRKVTLIALSFLSFPSVNFSNIMLKLLRLRKVYQRSSKLGMYANVVWSIFVSMLLVAVSGEEID